MRSSGPVGWLRSRCPISLSGEAAVGRQMLAYRIALTLISIAIVLIAFRLIAGTKLVKYLPECGLRAKLAGTRTPESRTG